MAHAVLDPPSGSALAGPAHDCRVALGLLTILRAERPEDSSPAFARATLFFPAAGLLIGVVLAALNWLLGDHVPPRWSAILLTAMWEGLAAFEPIRACGVVSRTEPHPRVVHTWSLGGRGAAVMGAVMAAKAACLAAAVAARTTTLLFAPLLGRWAMVVLATGARAAAAPDRKFNPAVTFREFAITSVFTFAVIFAIADGAGILLVAGTAGVTLGVRLLLHRWCGGVSWRLLLVSAEAIEITVLLLVVPL